MYEIYGDLKSQEIIVALPALGERKEMYKPLAYQLASYKWIVFDLPGHNGFETEETTIKSYVKSLKEKLEQLDVSIAHFVGNSLGAWIIKGFAEMYPETVTSLTLLDGGYYFLGEREETTEEVSLQLIENFDDIRDAVHDLTYSMEGLEEETYHHFERYFLENYIQQDEFYKHHSDEKVYNALSKEVTTTNYCLQQTNIPLSLLVAQNNLDEFANKKLNTFKSIHPTANIKTIQNGFHYLPLTNTKEVAEFMRNNLEQVGSLFLPK